MRHSSITNWNPHSRTKGTGHYYTNPGTHIYHLHISSTPAPEQSPSHKNTYRLYHSTGQSTSYNKAHNTPQNTLVSYQLLATNDTNQHARPVGGKNPHRNTNQHTNHDTHNDTDRGLH